MGKRWRNYGKSKGVSVSAYLRDDVYVYQCFFEICLWSQLWAVTIFGERLTARNVAGLVIVLAGVVVVSLSAGYGEE